METSGIILTIAIVAIALISIRAVFMMGKKRDDDQ